MNIRFLHGTALIAGLGVAVGLAGCNGNSSPAGSTGASVPVSNEAVANVGSTTITHGDLGAFLETQYGKSALPYLIDNQLVLEAGKAQKIEVSDADVDADLTRRAKTDPQVAALIKTPGPNTNFIKQQLKRELTVQRLLTQKVTATDEQLKTFFNKYQKYYNEPARIKVGLLASSTKARADAMSRSLKNKSKTFEQLVTEQKANPGDQAGFQASVADRGEFDLADSFGPTLGPQLAKLPKGGTTAPIAQPTGPGSSVYLIFRVIDVQPAKKADFTALRPVIETDYKMAQVAIAEVKKNPTNPPFDTAVERTKAAIIQQSQNPAAQPTFRDVLTAILQPASQNLIAALRTKGTVQISDPNYTTVAEQYQPAVTPAPSGAPAAAGTPGAAGTPAAGATAAGAAPAASATPKG